VKTVTSGFVATAALLGLLAAPTWTQAGTQGASCVGIRVESMPDLGGKNQVFSATEVIDLVFKIMLAGSNESSHIDVRVFTPNGHLFGALRVPVPDGARKVAAPPFLVAGTEIVRNSLYGKWRVEAAPEAKAPPSCKATFTIRP